jgi:cell division protein FtsQ
MVRRKKKKNWRRLINWILILAVLGLLIFLAMKFARQQSAEKCGEIVVEIEQVNGIEYIDKEEVKKYIIDNNDPIIGKILETIDLDSIEKSLAAFPFVRQAEVYTDLDSRLHVQIEQMIPILRVHPDNLSPYYISKEGKKTPLSKLYTPHVIVATGDIDEAMDRKLYTLMRYVNDSKVWNAQIEQIFVSRDQDIILIPKLGKFSVILGDVDQLESKFTKLETFFSQGLNKTGWDKYKSLNLKFNELIICK